MILFIIVLFLNKLAKFTLLKSQLEKKN